MANKTDFKKIILKADMSTDGDFGFRLMPNCMAFDGNEDYTINWEYYPTYYDTNETVIENVVKQLKFISSSLSEQIHGRDYVVERIVECLTKEFSKAIELMENTTKTDRINECMFSGNQEGYFDFTIIRNNIDNPEKDYTFVLRENTALTLAEKMRIYGHKNLDEHLNDCWEMIDTLWKENQSLRLNKE